ncbi:EutP/PduV family microcompartment system protein [Acerihabitans arboris]|uniref:EutP/PduV family microcompartment system protein n=1 Tax=Acerihabitans arboris TaxID=2691583 RepID=A0A845SIW7_9GAMM|nr:EutP/PduV family microcompartment system protein [Acerihabitans arboris]NDL63207.1 EutP/PduV family microcompartment system protein [Acerihabitans arboris]
MKRLMLLGPSQSGKTTLLQCLRGDPLVYQKTQALVYLPDAIDSPGEYIENRHFYSALLSGSYEADIVGLVQSLDNENGYFSPMFATLFNKPVIGIITKGDIPVDEKQKAFVINQLKQAGAGPLFMVSATRRQGITPLLTYLE